MRIDGHSETEPSEHDTQLKNSETLTDVLDRVCDSGSGEQVTFKKIVEALDQRAYGPLLLVPAVIAVAPTGAIPGMSLVTGTIIFLLAIQLLLGRSGPWLPASILEFSFSRTTLEKAIRGSRRYASFVDRFLKPRLTFMVSFPVSRLVALVCIESWPPKLVQVVKADRT